MHHNVTAAKDQKAMLAEIVQFIADPRHLSRGRPIGNFPLLPREAIANWLICAVLNHNSGSRDAWTFSTDPNGRDGILVEKAEKLGHPTEHVFIPRAEFTDDKALSDLMIAAVEKKQAKGQAYAEGTHLVIFGDHGGGDAWKPNVVGRALKGRHNFVSVWAVILQTTDGDDYVYGVTQFGDDVSPVFLVFVNIKTCDWRVEQIQ